MSWLLWLVVGCWTWETQEEQRAVENQLDMERHFEQAAAARDAVIRGDIAEAAASLKALQARLPLPALPEELRSHEEALASVLDGAGAPAAGGGAAGGAASGPATCGGCHRAAGVKHAPSPPPPEGGGMEAHQWAASAMWAGLVAGDDERVVAAFAALGDAAFAPEAAPDEALRATSPSVEDLQTLAAEAAAPGLNTAQRAAAYADFLETCAACHSSTGGGPR